MPLFFFYATYLSTIFETTACINPMRMPQIKNLENVELLNLLTAHTTLYTQMLTNNIKTEEFYACKQTIDVLTAEILARKERNIYRQLSGDSAICQINEE